ALKQTNFNLSVAGDHRKIQLNELNELHDHAYENSLIYKEKTKRIHDSKIKNRVFNVGDQVLLFNSRLKIFSGKLKSRWSGTFTIAKVLPYGTVELSQANGPNFKVNGHRIKHYFRGDVPQLGRTFWQTGEVNPRYVAPFKVLERVRDVAYKPDLSEELSRVHNTLHVSNLKKCHADEPLAVSLDGLHLDDKFYFVEKPMEIVDREVKRLKRSRIPLIKVRWNSKRGPEFT
nr:reverse transcriptase domain-containing protein [Tanacetum cinerariifolium]